MGKTNASGVFAILTCVTWTIKIQNSLLFHKFCQNRANSDITKEALNCTSSLQQLSALLTSVVSSGVLFYNPKTSSPQIRIRPDLSS